MTLVCTPGTIAYAMRAICDRLGKTKKERIATAASLTGVARRTIYSWRHPESTATPSMAQALALDAAYMKAGGDGAPLYEAYAAQLNIVVRHLLPCRRELAADLAEASREAGEAIAATAFLTIADAAPSAIQFASIQIKEAADAIDRLGRRVERFHPGAGPGNPGGAQ